MSNQHMPLDQRDFIIQALNSIRFTGRKRRLTLITQPKSLPINKMIGFNIIVRYKGKDKFTSLSE